MSIAPVSPPIRNVSANWTSVGSATQNGYDFLDVLIKLALIVILAAACYGLVQLVCDSVTV